MRDDIHLHLGVCPVCGGNDQIGVLTIAERSGSGREEHTLYCVHCHIGPGQFDSREAAEAWWVEQFGWRRQPLMADREHLTEDGRFQSDKYDWCPSGYLPLSLKDPMARDLIAEYAKRRSWVDKEFGRDVAEALENTEVEDKLHFAIVPGDREAMGVCGAASMVDVLKTDPDARFFPITKEQFDAWGDDQSVVEIPEDF